MAPTDKTPPGSHESIQFSNSGQSATSITRTFSQSAPVPGLPTVWERGPLLPETKDVRSEFLYPLSTRAPSPLAATRRDVTGAG
ncbi:hypothetical protein JYU34_007524 [Plutella xylostella]|uniref:Uncharacterized protein n=1 Tax=Plutella xylostella TaxID=51655 RepID=A0ABQ7QQM7_PLUXY|nr:hypothetical protein JYU34_007524 [Plutella xylostella]